jgi:transcriptional regulator
MYTPSHYRIDDSEVIRAFIKRHSFATLISYADSFQVTHLPFVVEETEQLMLSGHMARANPHWSCFADNPEVLVIFQGPHAYVSPSLYEEKVSVPTWDYAVVHAYGRARMVEDVELVLEKLIRSVDAEYLNTWRALPEEYKANMKKGIVGFEVVVHKAEAKFKMHQKSPRADRLRIIGEFSRSGDTNLAEVAEYIEQRLLLECEG